MAKNQFAKQLSLIQNSSSVSYRLVRCGQYQWWRGKIPRKLKVSQSAVVVEQAKEQSFEQTLDKVGEDYFQHKFEDEEDVRTLRKELNIALRRNMHPQSIIKLLNENPRAIDAVNVSSAMISLAYCLQYFYLKKNTDPPPKFYPDTSLNLVSLGDMTRAYSQMFPYVEEYMNLMDARTLSNCLWSLGKAADVIRIHQMPLRKRNVDFYYLFGKLSELLMEHKGVLNEIDAVNALWAMGKVSWTDHGHYKEILNRCKQGLQFKPQEIANILTAMAQLQHFNFDSIKFFLRLVKQELQYKNNLKALEIVNIVRALKLLRYYDEELMFIIETYIINRRWEFCLRDIANLSLSFADLGVQNKEVVDELVFQFSVQNECWAQNLSLFIFSMSIFEHPVDQVYDAIKNKHMYTNKKLYFRFRQSALKQIGRAYLTYRALGTPLQISQSLKFQCIEGSREDYQRRDNLVNSFLFDVFNFVKLTYPEAELRKYIARGLLQVHISIESKEKKVAVVTLRVNNYTFSKPMKMMGQAQAYIRLLELLDWQVVQVSQIKWKLDKDNVKQLILKQIKSYLRS